MSIPSAFKILESWTLLVASTYVANDSMQDMTR